MNIRDLINKTLANIVATGKTGDYYTVVTPVDSTGVPVGTIANPVVVSAGGGSGTSLPVQDVDLLERYRATGWDVYKFTGTRTGATTFTFAADSGMTITNNDVIQIVQRSVTGVMAITDMTTIVVSGTAPNYTITAAGAAFAATDTIIVYVRSNFRAYTTLTDNLRIAEVSDLSQKYEEIALVNLTDQATQSYPSSAGINMNNKKSVTIQGYLIDGDSVSSIEIETTNAAAPDANDYSPIYFYNGVTNTWVNIISVSSSATPVKFMINLDNLNCKNFRIKFTCAGPNTNTVHINLRMQSL